MSFDFAYWYEEEKSDLELAARKYDSVIDQKDGLIAPSERIGQLYEDLVNEFGELSEENQGSPFNDKIHRTDSAMLTMISWSRYQEIADRILELAARRSVTVYDPQNRIVNYPDGSYLEAPPRSYSD